ncbi:hypothetical protein VOLCADRAFT_87484 [Volvox carteri f. nagariensis]|uniref:TFIIF beta subunit HTH domain-containing protein n=1 Tax=Volvox carteri f. nagariensis TaxID=3068 RepID=D8TLG4_VOLCA|nr:uncharacterized protein VOLCADRAFT_87484 [Volvox carteri f. nagariensis]EFJ51871.1 hypothetical protein VOLCADRAFT_87484 [Volvox carteri f. nagariensis]|eukprot:XP_002947281.1 hypothetical protein VOLCADRAFT_87484 [Volvox carteri f. nagariensis]
MALDTRNADNAAWIVKVPYALASVWKAACEQSMAGQVDDSTEGPSLLGRIVTEPTAQAMLAEGIPRRFKLQQMPLPPGNSSKMHVMSYEIPTGGTSVPQGGFSQGGGGAAATGGGGGGSSGSSQAGRDISLPRVEGTIQQRMDMVPMVQDERGEWVLDSEYLKLVRSRTEQAAEKVRVVGYYEDSVDNVLADLAQQKRVEQDISARRKGLITETRQPHMHLKAVLEGIAAQQKRGPNKDKYELKPEYRSKSRAPGSYVNFWLSRSSRSKKTMVKGCWSTGPPKERRPRDFLMQVFLTTPRPTTKLGDHQTRSRPKPSSHFKTSSHLNASHLAEAAATQDPLVSPCTEIEYSNRHISHL